jgi:serine O-acetyltransferase
MISGQAVLFFDVLGKNGSVPFPRVRTGDGATVDLIRDAEHQPLPAPSSSRREHRWADGLAGDLARLFSHHGLREGRPSIRRALERVLTRPGPGAIVLYRLSHALWVRGSQTAAEILWRLNVFLTGADIHPGAEIGGGLRMTHTSGVVIGRGVKIGSNVTILHGVTLGGSARGWFDGVFEDGFPEIGDDTEIMAGAKVLGPIRVGRGCFVGANAVLAHDLPDGEAFTPGREIADLRHRVEHLERLLSPPRTGARP